MENNEIPKLLQYIIQYLQLKKKKWDIQRIRKLTDTQEEIYSQEVKWWLPGAQGNEELLFNGYKFSVWEGEMFWRLVIVVVA